MLGFFKTRFWQPPRPHGEVIEDRSVGFIELFYDLIYVVVIARAAHHLSGHLTWRGTADFAVVFGMIWLAWLNGTLYHDLHGREDGRSRSFIFLQMGILALLAVYTAEATGADGRGFAIVYTAFLLVLTWMWFTVRRQDSEEYMATTARYLAGMVASVIVAATSAVLPSEARTIAWALLVAGWIAGAFIIERRMPEEIAFGTTDSLVERFGLFTIIVLGEVVVGAVTGLSEAERGLGTIATGIIGLMIGFGIWWTYFDFVGSRHPTQQGARIWMFSHLPVTLSIAASGAALVSLIEHASETRSPANAAWLLTGSVALTLLALVLTIRALADYERLPTIYRPLTTAMLIAALASPLVGWWRPTPWVLTLAIVGLLTAVWLVAINRLMTLENPREANPQQG